MQSKFFLLSLCGCGTCFKTLRELFTVLVCVSPQELGVIIVLKTLFRGPSLFSEKVDIFFYRQTHSCGQNAKPKCVIVHKQMGDVTHEIINSN